jgi:hypothetical protein
VGGDSVKKRFIFLLIATAAFMATIACVSRERSLMTSLDVDEIIIEYQHSQGEAEEISLTSKTILSEIFTKFSSISAYKTSEPMAYPRLTVKFQKDGFTVTNWVMDDNRVTSSGKFGWGNRKITNDFSSYDDIYELFSSILVHDHDVSRLSSLDFDEVIIGYQHSQDEATEEISFMDGQILTDIFTKFSSISAYATSEPMGFPRFIVTFQKDGSTVADWLIDDNQVMASRQFGWGNRKITNGDAFYGDIYEMFSTMSPGN